MSFERRLSPTARWLFHSVQEPSNALLKHEGLHSERTYPVHEEAPAEGAGGPLRVPHIG